MMNKNFKRETKSTFNLSLKTDQINALLSIDRHGVARHERCIELVSKGLVVFVEGNYSLSAEGILVAKLLMLGGYK